MSESVGELESIKFFPPRIGGGPQQWISDMEFLRRERIERVYEQQLEEQEVLQLREENKMLKEQLELVICHPLYDETSNRINVSHEQWQIQRMQIQKLESVQVRYRLMIVISVFLSVALAWSFLHGVLVAS